MKRVRVLVVQYKIQYLDLQANLKKIRDILRTNIYLKPDIVIFPEYALTGPLYAHYDKAFDKGDPVFDTLRKFAQQYKVYLIPGSFVTKNDTGKYNTTCIISNKGKIEAYYSKQKLWGSEKKFLRRGSEAVVVPTQYGRISVQICADLTHPVISHELQKLEPHIIINLSLWSKEDKNVCTKSVPDALEYNTVELLSKARALENKCYFIFCNYADRLKLRSQTGREYPITSIGSTMIVNPYGETIAATSSTRKEILCTELDITKCHWSKS